MISFIHSLDSDGLFSFIQSKSSYAQIVSSYIDIDSISVSINHLNFTNNIQLELNEYTLEFPIVSCLGDVLEPDTAYVFYLSQRLEGNTIKTLSSIKGIGINEKAFGLEYKSIVFYTISGSS